LQFTTTIILKVEKNTQKISNCPEKVVLFTRMMTFS